MRTKTSRVAFCGMIAALSAAVLFLAGLVPVATVAAPAIAGCLLIAVVAEIDVHHGFAVYAAVSVLAALVVPDREAALIYILFFGYYPALYGLLGRIPNRVLRYVIKLLLFNAAAVAEAALAIFLLGIPAEEAIGGGAIFAAVLLLLANAVFVLYDLCMNGLIVFYIRRLHPFVKKYFR